MMISNTPTLTSYTWTYFVACLCILLFLLIIWLVYVLFYQTLFKSSWKYFYRVPDEQYFVRRSINENRNLDILVRIREQSQRLLPYRHIIPLDEQVDTADDETDKDA